MNSEKLLHVGWYNEQTKQFENLYLEKYVNELKQEIARLNKIIDELENYLIFQIKHTDKAYIFGEVYYKLKELKEEGKD